MLVEKQLSEALKDYDQGKKVIVMTVMCDGSMSCDLLEDLFGNTETHFLVDVPTYNNPEFGAAVQAIVSNYTVQEAESPAEEPAEDPKAFGGVPEPMEGKTTRNIVEEMVRQGLTNSEDRVSSSARGYEKQKRVCSCI